MFLSADNAPEYELKTGEMQNTNYQRLNLHVGS
jgi:hypothetical protein